MSTTERPIPTRYPRVYLPYCFDRLENGNYQALNREYQPISPGSEIRLTPKLMDKISVNTWENYKRVYLYTDRTNPMNSATDLKNYMEKLRLVSKARVTQYKQAWR